MKANNPLRILDLATATAAATAVMLLPAAAVGVVLGLHLSSNVFAKADHRQRVRRHSHQGNRRGLLFGNSPSSAPATTPALMLQQTTNQRYIR
jgi:hypothetical protein